MLKVIILSTQKYAGHMTIKFKVDQTTYSAEGHEDSMKHFEKLLYASSKQGFHPFATAAWHKMKKDITVTNLDKPKEQPDEQVEQMDLFHQAVKLAKERSA